MKREYLSGFFCRYSNTFWI